MAAANNPGLPSKTSTAFSSGFIEREINTVCNANQHRVEPTLHNLCKFHIMHVREKLLDEALTLQRALSLSETDFATELGVSLATWSNWKARNAISKDGLEKILENRPDLVLSLAGKEIRNTGVADAAASLIRLANAQDDFSDEQTESPEITQLIKAARNAPKSAVKAATELLAAAAKPQAPKRAIDKSKVKAWSERENKRAESAKPTGARRTSDVTSRPATGRSQKKTG